MVSGLVQKLRTCSAEERRLVAMELAETRTEESVDELINMINAGVRIYQPTETKYREVLERPHWWSIKKVEQQKPYEYDPSEYYDLSDQLIGIEAIGKTGSRRALDYLTNLINYDYSETQSDSGQMQGSDFYPDWQEDICSFSNARGELEVKLFTSSTHGVCEGGKGQGFGEEYQLIEMAIKRLENALQQGNGQE